MAIIPTADLRRFSDGIQRVSGQGSDHQLKATDLPSLRFVTSSSAPLSVEHWTTFEAMYGIPIAQGYGSSEALWIACSNERSRRIGSVGVPLISQKLAIVNQDGRPLPAGKIGELVFKESMPKNDRGKLDRKALAEDWQRTRNVLG